jgi:hypothetical protein
MSSTVELVATALGSGGLVAIANYLATRRKAKATEVREDKRTVAAQAAADATIQAAHATAEPAVIEQVRSLLADAREDMRAARIEAEAARVEAREAKRLADECEYHREIDGRRCAEEIEGVRAEVTLLAQRAIRSGSWSDTGLHEIERLARRKTPSREVLAQTPGLRLPEPGGDDR